MKTLAGTAVAAVLGLTGCSVQSALNDTDTVAVNGRALQEDGSPVKEETLKLHRSIDSVCAINDHYRDVKTDAQGVFSLELTGAETRNGDTARCFTLVTPTVAAGARTSVQFLLQETEVEIPSLQLWRGGASATPKTGGIEVGWSPLAAAHGGTAVAQVEVRTGTDAIAWVIAGGTRPVEIGDDLLEDFDGLEAQLSSKGEVKDFGTTFKFLYLTDAVALPKRQRVPASRGAACQLGAREWETGCPFTDGSVTAPTAFEPAPDLRLTFDAPRAVKKAILRGLATLVDVTVVVEVSTDGGVNWTTAARATDIKGVGTHFLELALDASTPVADTLRVRVEGANEPKIHGLRELSVFE